MDAYIMKIIDQDNGKEITLPITPDEIEKSGSVIEKDFNAIVSGSKPRPKGREAYTYPFSGIITEGELASFSDITPFEFEELIESWQEGLAPYNKKLRLIVSETTINKFVYLKNHSVDYSKGGRTIRYTLTFVEWRDFNIKVYDANKTSKRPTAPLPKVHVVKKGDNLWNIARKYTGKGAKWREMWAINKKASRSKNPNLIYPGEKYSIPSGWLK